MPLRMASSRMEAKISKGFSTVDMLSKAGIHAVNSMSRSSHRMVDEFLADMEPKSLMIRTVSRAGHDDVVPEWGLSTRAYKIHTSFYWKMFINVSIVLNAIQIGLDAEISGSVADDAWLVCDHVFTVIFAVEFAVAIAAIRWQYFHNPWNYLDFVVANIAIINTWILPFVDKGAEPGGLSVFRVFRLLKLLRVARMLKVIPELMMVVQGLVASIRAMFWIFMLLVIFLYTAGIFCTTIIGAPDSGYPSFSEQVMADKAIVTFNNFLYFGSISRSMTTLFNMVILAEWQEVLRPVYEHQPAMVLFFVCIVFLCSFGVLNVMIGIVVEHTTSAMAEQREEQQIQIQKTQIRLASTLADIVFTLDVNHDERISREELENVENGEELHAIIGSLGLPHGYSLQELFVMLDVDGNGYLSKLEFVQGIMRLIYCDQFQRDCLFRTAIGEVKQAVSKAEERLMQSFKYELQETYAGFISALKHQGGSWAPCNIDDVTVDNIKNDEYDFLPEHTPQTNVDITQVVYLGVRGTEELDLSGQWNGLASTETLVLEAVEVSILGNAGGQGGTRASLIGSGGKESKDAQDANANPHTGGCQKQVTWSALQKSLLPMETTEAGCAFDASTAEKMVYSLSRSHEVIGWMPVVNTRQADI